MPIDKQDVLRQIQTALTFYTQSRIAGSPLTVVGVHFAQFNMMVLTIIDRVTGRDSTYGQQVHATIDRDGLSSSSATVITLGVLEVLKSDIEHDYLITLEELIHASIFSDYLDSAYYLLGEGYKDPAAMLAGGTLEEHLRKLCQKNNIPTDDQKPHGAEPKKASSLNADLYRASIYSNAQQQQVTAWLAIRNNAAHGNYSNYSSAEVNLFMQGLRDFILRHPA